jgi:hypothetical protein
MNDKICLIQQSCGLGDILFTIKVGKHFASQGYRVIWPVESVYNQINEFIDTSGQIEFYDISESFPYKKQYGNFDTFRFTEIQEISEITYVPLSRAFFSNAAQSNLSSFGHEAANMFGKYLMCSLDHEGWQKSFSVNRHPEKETKLLNELGLSLGDKIHLVNDKFGSPPNWTTTLNKTIHTPAEFKRVDMSMITGFNITDWLGIIEKSRKIDTVATSIVFLFEKINLLCVPTIHSRNKSLGHVHSAEDDFRLMSKIYSKDYHYER